MPGKVLRTLFTAFLLLSLCTVYAPQVMAARDSTGFNYQIISGRKYYNLRDIARYLRMDLRKIGKYYEMRNSQRRMVFNPQKRYGSFNNTVINYDFVPVEKNGQIYVSAADFFSHIQVLNNVRSLRPAGVRTIVIDAGHGGKDQGAAGVRYQEKTLTLQVARRLQKTLNKMGYRALMTRVNDRKLELSDRARASNSVKADLFISIHMNAAANRSVRGIETFALTASGSPSSGSKTVQYKYYPGNPAAANSTYLAWSVQNSLIRYTRGIDRGMKRARFVVLRETRCPSILVECGFISNRAEEKLLGEPAYQERLAQAIALGIYQYHQSLRTAQ